MKQKTTQEYGADREGGNAVALSPIEERIARILQGTDFPALSKDAVDTLTAMQDDDASAQRLASVVLREYGLTLKVLRTVNSAHYRRSGRPIQSATHAMLILGARTVRQIAGSLMLFEHYRQHSPGLKELMLMSLLTANHARELAVKLRLAEPEEVHLCGMFRNLGEILVACHFPQDYARIVAMMSAQKKSEANASFAVLGFRYEELAEALSRHWGMPETVLMGFRSVGASAASLEGLIVAFGSELTNVIYRKDGSSDRDSIEDVCARFESKIPLSREQVREVVAAALTETREVFASAKVSLDDLRLRQMTNAALIELGARSDEMAVEGSAYTTPLSSAAVSMPQLREGLELEGESACDPVSGGDLGTALLVILEGVMRGGPFDRALALVLNSDRTEVRARFGIGPGADALIEKFRFPMTSRGGPLVAALLTRRPLYVPSDRAFTAIEQKWATSLGIASYGVFPVVVAGKLVGCLYADRVNEERAPDRETLAFVQRLSHQAVRAIETRRDAAAPPPNVRRVGEVAEGDGRSAESKSVAVMRLLRGEDIAAVSGELAVSVAELERWREDFLAGAMERLTTGRQGK